MRYVSLVLLGMLVSLLAGCGGGDDGAKRSLEEDLALVQADLDAAQSELATTKDTLSTTQDTLTTTQTDLATAQEELATTKATLATTQETLSTTQEDLVEANADLEDKEAELATTQADLMTTEDELDTAETQLTTTRINLATANANLTNAQTNLMTAQADLMAAQTELDEKTSQLTTTQSELATAKANLTTEQADLLDAQADLKTAQDALTAETAKLVMAQSDLATARANLTAETAKLATAQSSLTAAQTRANNLQTQVTTLTNTVASLRTQLGQAQQQVTDTQTTANQQISSLEQTTRSLGLLTALGSPFGTTNLVTTNVPSRGSLRITAPNYSASNISGVPTGFKATRLRRTIGSSQLEMVAYTDQELNRRLIDHFGRPADAREFDISTGVHEDIMIDVGETETDGTITGGEDITALDHWTISHGFSTTRSSAPTLPAHTMKERTSVTGRFRGQSGTFQCGTNCELTLVADYDPVAGDTTDPIAQTLNTVMIGVPADETLTFRPSSSARIYLDSVTGSSPGVGTDGQYMVFGWWKSTPDSATGTYEFDAFMQTEGAWSGSANPTSATGTATYDGPAAGAYVEEGLLVGESGGARHGEFTATAHLTAVFTAPDPNPNNIATGLRGYVDGFKTTRSGSSSAVSKSWRVNLWGAADSNGVLSTAAIGANIAGTAVTISLTGAGGGTATGSWQAQFLANQANSRANSGDAPQPLAAAGVFDASIEDLLHVSGAFGVHRTVPE